MTATPDNWKAFLRSASRNYRLPFDEQLLIHVQRPEATAVLEMEKWNEKFGRWVKRDSKGIAVFDKSAKTVRLKYYFDVSDTREGRYKRLVRPVPLWEVSESHSEAVRETLANAFGVTGETKGLAETILEAADHAAEDNVADYMQDILSSREGSFLEELDEYNVEVEVRRLLSASTSYMLMVRCGIQPEMYLETEDFRNITDFNTPQLVNLFGVAASDISEMALSHIADTVRKLQIEEKKQNRTFAAGEAARYNEAERIKADSERSPEYENDRIQQAGRLSTSEPDRTRRTGGTHWEVRLTSPELPEGAEVWNFHHAADTGETERTPDGDTADSAGEAGADRSGDGESAERDGGTESERPDDVARHDEQLPAGGGGDRDEGTDLQLENSEKETEQQTERDGQPEEAIPTQVEWYDRSNEDKSLPFFYNEEDIKSLLLSTPHLKASKEEISKFFETHEDERERTEYLKDIFNNEYTEFTLEDGRHVGYKTYQNVLHIWEGNYLSHVAQSYYDWGVIARYFDGMRLVGELRDKAEPLRSVEEQLSFMEDVAEEKTSAFSFSQEIVDTVIQSGSHIEHGKYRIYAYFLQTHTNKEKADFLKDEYGYVGVYPLILGADIDMQADAKGLHIHRKKDSVTLKWTAVAKRIDELIALERYLSKHERAYLPEYEKDVLAREIYHFYSNQSESVARPYPFGADYYAGTKAIRPQLDMPERVEEILSVMAEVLANTADFARNYAFMQKAYHDLTDYRDGVYSLFSSIPQEPEYTQTLPPVMEAIQQKTDTKDTKNMEVPESEQQKAEQQMQELPVLNPPYDLAVDSIVSIGMKEYSIDFISDEMVVLRDQMYPLFTEEMPREEFDRKIRENPANDHLKVRRPLPGLPAEKTNIPAPGAPEVSEPETDELDLLWDVLDSLHIEDIQLRYDEDGTLTASDGENVWKGKEFYEFLLQEAITFEEDGSSAVLTDGQLSDLYELAGRYGVEVPGGSKETPAGTEQVIDLAPAWEQPKVPERVQSFDLYPEIPQAQRSQYRITNDELGYGTPKEKFRANIMAIQLLKKCEEEHRYATPEEQEILSGYVGWGGLSDAFDETKSSWGYEYLELKSVLTEEEYTAARQSTLTAFYTPPVVIRAMYQALEDMGLRSGNILEPSCATGNFIGMKPDSLSECKMYGVEIDSISGRIAQQLYQKSTIAVQGYEDVNLPDSFFDVAIGNVPFGQFKVSDRRYDKHNFLIHDYFFAKTLDKVRPGGVVAFITSSGTMDKKNPAIRKYIAQRAELLGAIRLPNNTFKRNAGTEVTTDILFLQKRDRLIETEPEWLYLDKDGNGITQNRYFVQHPEMILGEMVLESTQYGMDSTCRSYEGSDLETLLTEAVGNIHAEITEYETEELVEEIDNTIPADPSVANFSYTVLDGKIYYRENSCMKPVELSVTGVNRVKGMAAIRDCVRELIEYQTQGYSDTVIEAQQKKLNQLYDRFQKKYGLLNARANSMVFSDDNSYPLLCSLEIVAEDGTLERKADMFYKRTIKPHAAVTRVDTASEALSLSLSEKACVDMEYMCSLTGKDAAEIERELSGVIFRLPDMRGEGEPEFVSEDEYLSGNVRQKLREARLAAQSDPVYESNVEALLKVQPKDLTASEISVRLGTTWIPTQDVEDFMFGLLETPNYARWHMKVQFFQLTGEWQIEGKSNDKGNVKANNTYGTHRASAYKIIEDTLNLRDTRIYDYVEDEEGKKKAILNKKETAIAQGKQDLIKQAFQDWIWKDPKRRRRLTDYYNEHFNAIRPREYDGSHLKFYGINPEIQLRQHQKNGVARIIYGGNTLLAYVVGAGKTYTMVAAAMECKRLGLCNKSMIVVPNHIIEQFAAEWLQLYPAANLLVATKKDFERKNRKKFCARIATSDIDAVIIGHSQFEKIPLSVERQQRMLERQLDEIISGIAEAKARKGSRFTVKQLEKTKKGLEGRLKKLNDQSRKDDVVTFEELGIDRLFVDEADGYKNLYLYTKMRNVGGIAQTEAQKSSDMFMKCQYLDELTGGKGVIFATGTPVSNSMVELYTMQRYLQYHTLERNNLQYFDAWASTFGETVTAIELAPEGSGYRLKTRFAKFYNLPELMQMFREVADIQTADMLNLPVPEAQYRVISVKPSEMQRKMVEELGNRAERVRNGMVNPKEDNMLKITNDGRKLALDQRLANEMLTDEPESKVNACIDEVCRFWEEEKEKKLTQLLFCDLSTPKNDGTFSVYNDVRDKLIAKGIPPEEIAFIHNANTDVQKKELFSKVRRGAVRILMGSTFKMGAGTNVQNLIIASHDLDCPWRPRDVGRILRTFKIKKNVEVTDNGKIII